MDKNDLWQILRNDSESLGYDNKIKTALEEETTT